MHLAEMFSKSLTSEMSSFLAVSQVDLAARAAKAELQNVRAESSRIFFEPPRQNIRAELLEPQNFPGCIFKLSVIFA